jgi:hypothetical protein
VLECQQYPPGVRTATAPVHVYRHRRIVTATLWPENSRLEKTGTFG